MRHALVALVSLTLAASACASSGSTPTPPLAITTSAEPAADAVLAYIATNAGVVAVDLEGTVVATLVPGEVENCLADPRGQTLWFVRTDPQGKGAEEPARVIYALDLTRPGAEPVRVVAAPTSDLVLDYGDETVGLPHAHQFRVLPVITLHGTPGFVARVGCDGDMGFFCYVEGDGSQDDDAPELVAEVADEVALIEAAVLQAPDELARIAARAAGRRYWVASSLRPAIQVAVDASACEEAPEECGAADPVPGTPYYVVTVANERGDFFYRSRQLYDPATERFFDPREPAARSATPLSTDLYDSEQIRVASSGVAFLDYNALVRFDRGVVFTGTQTCGWSTPSAALDLNR